MSTVMGSCTAITTRAVYIGIKRATEYGQNAHKRSEDIILVTRRDFAMLLPAMAISGEETLFKADHPYEQHGVRVVLHPESEDSTSIVIWTQRKDIDHAFIDLFHWSGRKLLHNTTAVPLPKFGMMSDQSPSPSVKS